MSRRGAIRIYPLCCPCLLEFEPVHVSYAEVHRDNCGEQAYRDYHRQRERYRLLKAHTQKRHEPARSFFAAVFPENDAFDENHDWVGERRYYYLLKGRTDDVQVVDLTDVDPELRNPKLLEVEQCTSGETSVSPSNDTPRPDSPNASV